MIGAPASPVTAPDLSAYARLFAELQDLKRQQPAHLSRSIATDLFRAAWAGLLAGEPPAAVARRTALRALTNVLFPGCDATFWPRSGLRPQRAAAILTDALRTTAGCALTPATLHELERALPDLVAVYYDSPAEGTDPPLPAAVDVLCRQPRAGATRPGYPRLLLLPPEMHSDHCLLTAVYGYLLAEPYGADAARVFVCALAHHLHNAVLPDCGFSGEMCLGPDLEAVIDHCRGVALAELPPALAERVRRELRFHDTIDSPEGRAESAADVLDRVLDVRWRTRAAGVTDADILGDLDLVHPGPLRNFQDDLLRNTGLWQLS